MGYSANVCWENWLSIKKNIKLVPDFTLFTKPIQDKLKAIYEKKYV